MAPYTTDSSSSRDYHVMSAAENRQKVKPLTKQAFNAVLLLSVGTLFGHQANSQQINNSVSVFSTYPSEALESLCSQSTLTASCSEDAIAPTTLINAIQTTRVFSALTPFAEGSDYELLIANVGHSEIDLSSQFVEFTLQWRGIEIDSAMFNTAQRASSKDQLASELVMQWVEHIKVRDIFSTRYLYSALDASNYESSLTVPERVGDFTKLDTQLYADPFSGAITRYTHPSYEDALVDVTVYPILDSLDKEVNLLLNNQLDQDYEKANSVASAQQLTLSLSDPASPYSVNPTIQGWRLGLKAESETADPIYASTYVFRKEDKFVKVATTFPTHFSDPLVNELITHVQVPKESPLMKNIREMLSKQIN